MACLYPRYPATLASCHPFSQLSAGFKSALGSLGTDSSSLTKMAGGLASWWGSLDPPTLPKRNEMQERVQASSKVQHGEFA